MGNGLIEFYKNKITKSRKLAFLSAFVAGLLIHIYKFTNNFMNHDSLFNIYSDQNMISSGRWFLSIACSFSSYFDLPWVTGLLSIIFIALTAVVIVDIFKIENPVMIILTGALLVSFPAITQTFYFQYTSDGYMLAMLLGALAMRLSVMGKRRPIHIILSAVFICLSCGIYQAYVSFALVLAVSYFISETLEGKRSNKEIGIFVGNQAIVYTLGLGAYYLIWQISMKITGCKPTSYEGMSSVGDVNLSHILKSFKKSADSFFSALTEWDISKHGLTAYSSLNLVFFGLLIAILIYACIRGKLYTRKLQLVLSAAAFIFIPSFVFIWLFVSPGVRYGMRMEQSICILYILAGVLFCRWAKTRAGNFAAVLLTLIVLNNSLSANLFYIYMEKCNKSSYTMVSEIATRIHMLDDGNIKNIAVIGEIPWKLYDNQFKYESSGLRHLGGLKEIRRSIVYDENHIAMYLNLLDFRLVYYIKNPGAEIPDNFGSEVSPVSSGWKLKFPLCDKSTKKTIKNSSCFKQMGCFPASDSIQVIGETVVIKLSDK